MDSSECRNLDSSYEDDFWVLRAKGETIDTAANSDPGQLDELKDVAEFRRRRLERTSTSLAATTKVVRENVAAAAAAEVALVVHFYPV